MDKPKVSVIVPIYNVEQYLKKCIESIQNQTYKIIEIILVDDGATDSSGSICDNFAKNDERIKVIHQKNGGLSNARNTGIRASSGNYLYFVDSDDYIEPTTIEDHLNTILAHDLDISLADVFIEMEDGQKRPCSRFNIEAAVMLGEDYLAERIKKQSYFIMVYMGMYKASLIKENELYFCDGILHEDEEWSPRVLLSAKRVMYTSNCYYNYVQHSQSITKSNDKIKNLESTFYICEKMENFFLHVLLQNEENRKYYLDMLVRLYMSMSCCGNFPESTYKRFDKNFPKKYAYMERTKKQVKLYEFNIHLYRYIRKLLDKINHF